MKGGFVCFRGERAVGRSVGRLFVDEGDGVCLCFKFSQIKLLIFKYVFKISGIKSKLKILYIHDYTKIKPVWFLK